MLYQKIREKSFLQLIISPILLQNHLRDMFKSVQKLGGNTDPISRPAYYSQSNN